MMTSGELSERVDAVLELILQGTPRKSIIKYVTKKYKVVENTVDDYIARARAVIKESANIDRPLELGKAFNRLERLYFNLYRQGDFKGCKDVQKEISELFGIKNFNIKSINFDGDKLPPEERERILRELNILKDE